MVTSLDRGPLRSQVLRLVKAMPFLLTLPLTLELQESQCLVTRLRTKLLRPTPLVISRLVVQVLTLVTREWNRLLLQKEAWCGPVLKPRLLRGLTELVRRILYTMVMALHRLAGNLLTL